MQTLSASALGIHVSSLSPAILEVIDGLSRAGFEAYVVGGSVRDLMLGLSPKDFDAVTNATPTQIREVFGRRCRIIGRRFELAHVYIGRELIEVATFRAPPRHNATSANGMILRDNVWGTIEQDFARRDFTINALYYQPRADVVLDFCGGVRDLQSRTLRFLGDPLQRFEEDPVRLLRVLRFAAKLEFRIDPSILQVLDPAMARLLHDVSPHRLYDESQKMFGGGHLLSLLPLLIEHHVWPTLLGRTAPVVTPLIERAALSTDQRIAAGKSVNPAFFYAVLLWQQVQAHQARLVGQGLEPADAMGQAGMEVMRSQQKHTAIPRYAEVFIREIWELQSRLIQPRARQVPALLQHPRFRAAFDFLLLREQSGDAATQGMGDWWERYQAMDNDQREQAIRLLNREQTRRRNKAARQPLADEATAGAVPGLVEDLPPEDGALPDVAEQIEQSRGPRRNRRRERSAASAPVEASAGALSAVEASATSRFRRKRRPRDLSQVFMGPY